MSKTLWYPYKPQYKSDIKTFSEKYCDNCKRGQKHQCATMLKAIVTHKDSIDYPQAMIINDSGQPQCLEFDKLFDKGYTDDDYCEQADLLDLFGDVSGKKRNDVNE